MFDEFCCFAAIYTPRYHSLCGGHGVFSLVSRVTLLELRSELTLDALPPTSIDLSEFEPMIRCTQILYSNHYAVTALWRRYYTIICPFVWNDVGKLSSTENTTTQRATTQELLSTTSGVDSTATPTYTVTTVRESANNGSLTTYGEITSSTPAKLTTNKEPTLPPGKALGHLSINWCINQSTNQSTDQSINQSDHIIDRLITNQRGINSLICPDALC